MHCTAYVNVLMYEKGICHNLNPINKFVASGFQTLLGTLFFISFLCILIDLISNIYLNKLTIIIIEIKIFYLQAIDNKKGKSKSS